MMRKTKTIEKTQDYTFFDYLKVYALSLTITGAVLWLIMMIT
ncbi:MAG: hypothetical protein ACTSUF_09725 [Candidatus Heimdallarchaeaceae archaeon]